MMLKNNPEKCLTGDDPYAQAVARKILGSKSSFYRGVKKILNEVDPQLLKDVAERQKKCKLYLTIDSKITEDDRVSVKNEVLVAGEIGPLKFNFKNGKVFLTGQVDIENFYQDVKISPYKTPDGKDWCEPWQPDDLDSVKPKAIVTKIDLVIAEGPNGVLQQVELLPMLISDKTIFQSMMNCTHIQEDGTIIKYSLSQKIPAKKGSLWNGLFIAAHMAEREYKFVVLPADSRNLLGHPLIARYISDRPSFSPGYGTWSENTTFELVDKSSK